ncbi:MAG: oxygen-independent coproporphyrinogen III oxidase [Candidatus Marinimicrobia bacterium]|nr:oxygen-independent coproporphyrinogen III oxidase [Candidatus Neomarinimicrobiota bacterium]
MSLKVDLELVSKYNRPGPRYTSYPTAPHFSSEVKAEDWSKAIAVNNASAERDLSLYLHLPFCDTLCYFCGCTTIITRNKDHVETYLSHLLQELELFGKMMNPDRKVVQQHFGGGTPTYLEPDQIRRLGGRLQELFPRAADAEIGCEIDPRGLTREHLVALREVGFNRSSIGVQDFNPRVQKAVNRLNSESMLREIVDWHNDLGFESLNLDLIYGLPFQTPESFEKTLQTILSFNPDRLAVFSYAHVPWMKPNQKLIKETDLPSPDVKLAMLKMIIETLTASGYVYIGMDHFAKANDELAIAQREKTLQRNFQGYSTKAGVDIYAFGMSSISQVDSIYAQNTKDINLYQDHIKAGTLPIEKGYILTEEDVLRRNVIMRLMCDLEIDFKNMSRSLNLDFKTHFEKELSNLDEFQQDGLIEVDTQRLKVTDKGRLFIRNIAMTFDAYLGEGEGRFSKTI